MASFYIITISAIVILSLLYWLLVKFIPAKTFSTEVVRIMKEKDPDLCKVFEELSDTSGYPLEAIVYTHYSLIKDQETKVNTPDRTCEIFLETFNGFYHKSPKKGIMALKIESSRDLGKIAVALHEKGIIELPKKVSEESFADQFKSLD